MLKKYGLSSFLEKKRKKERKKGRKKKKKIARSQSGSRSRETRDQMHILQEFSRPCIFSKLAFLRVIVTLYGFAYAFRDKSTVRKCAYATYFLPVSSRYVSSVHVCVCVCACVYACVSVTSVCRHTCASTRVHVSAVSACVYQCVRACLFFFFFPSLVFPVNH